MAPRKSLGSRDALWVQSLTDLAKAQPKEVLAKWSMDYAEEHILPIFKARCPGDDRPQITLDAARSWFRGEVKLPHVKAIILQQCHQAAGELDHDPAAQAAARCIGQVASTCHSARHALGLVFYGTAALAYHHLGTGQSADTYDAFAAQQCALMEQALLMTIAAAPQRPE